MQGSLKQQSFVRHAKQRLQVPSAAAEHQPKALSSLHGKYSVKH